ncbi:hypothetical protein SDC9_148969 [bioreactor metagenome]|uniref:Uncharacterized protein n=1 Tax=bioreactor metagenome TaxID=1076179 RepID=A0A645EJ29_9ZZZZ
MAFAGRNSEIPGDGRPQHDGKHARAKRDGCIARIRPEVDHVVDRLRNSCVEQRHHKHTEEIEHRRHHDCRARAHRARRDTGCNRVWRIRPTVDENNAQRQRNGNHQRRVGRKPRQKICKCNRHPLPFSLNWAIWAERQLSPNIRFNIIP